MHVVDRMQIMADRALVAEVVRSFKVCRKVNPAPVKWEHGHLDVDANWQRIAVGAYVGGKPYLVSSI